MTVEMPVYLSHVLHLCSSLLDGSICNEYDVSTSVAIHISLLNASMVAYMQTPFLSFIVLWSIHVGCCGLYPQLALGSSLGPDIITV